MEVVVPMLNEEPAVVAYSWFSYGEGRSVYFNDNANLFSYSDGNLNALGRAYFRSCALVATSTSEPTPEPTPHPGIAPTTTAPFEPTPAPPTTRHPQTTVPHEPTPAPPPRICTMYEGAR